MFLLFTILSIIGVYACSIRDWAAPGRPLREDEIAAKAMGINTRNIKACRLRLWRADQWSGRRPVRHNAGVLSSPESFGFSNRS